MHEQSALSTSTETTHNTTVHIEPATRHFLLNTENVSISADMCASIRLIGECLIGADVTHSWRLRRLARLSQPAHEKSARNKHVDLRKNVNFWSLKFGDLDY